MIKHVASHMQMLGVKNKGVQYKCYLAGPCGSLRRCKASFASAASLNLCCAQLHSLFDCNDAVVDAANAFAEHFDRCMFLTTLLPDKCCHEQMLEQFASRLKFKGPILLIVKLQSRGGVEDDPCAEARNIICSAGSLSFYSCPSWSTSGLSPSSGRQPLQPAAITYFVALDSFHGLWQGFAEATLHDVSMYVCSRLMPLQHACQALDCAW